MARYARFYLTRPPLNLGVSQLHIPSDVIQFSRANAYWWRRPLVRLDSRTLPAELAVLSLELQPSENGAWLNAPTKASGIVDFQPVPSGLTYRAIRKPLPLFVVATLERINQQVGLGSDYSYLLIWRADRESVRIVEVKWSGAQRRRNRVPFADAAGSLGIPTTIVEWQFVDDDGNSDAR